MYTTVSLEYYGGTMELGGNPYPVTATTEESPWE